MFLWVGHGAFEGCVSLSAGGGGGFARQPPWRPRAALELAVQHLGTNSGNVGLENANFSPDLRDKEDTVLNGESNVFSLALLSNFGVQFNDYQRSLEFWILNIQPMVA